MILQFKDEHCPNYESYQIILNTGDQKFVVAHGVTPGFAKWILDSYAALQEIALNVKEHNDHSIQTARRPSLVPFLHGGMRVGPEELNAEKQQAFVKPQ